MEKAIVDSGFKPEQTWGELIEDRGSQITFSALGQEAPVDVKKVWDPDFEKRKKIKAILDPILPDFTVRLGGATSIDITKPGIDKAYGIAENRRDPRRAEGRDAVRRRRAVPRRQRLPGQGKRCRFNPDA